MRKNKKLLLASVAAMGALALGVGATSTFAWFGARAAAAIENSPENNASVVVSKTEANIGGITVPLTVTLESEIADATKLLYATYDGTVDAPKLQTGYVTSAGELVPVAATSVSTVYGSGYSLSSTLKVTISIDLTAKRTDDGHTTENRWQDVGSTGSINTYYFGGIAYGASEIVGSLDDLYVDIGFSATGRGCLFETEAASGNPNYSGLTSKAADNYYYYKTNIQLDGISTTSSKVVTNAISYYINGNAGSNNTQGDTETSTTVNFADVFGVKVKAHPAA